MIDKLYTLTSVTEDLFCYYITFINYYLHVDPNYCYVQQAILSLSVM